MSEPFLSIELRQALLDARWIVAALAALSLFAWVSMMLEWFALRGDEREMAQTDDVATTRFDSDSLPARIREVAQRSRRRPRLDLVETETQLHESRLDRLAILAAAAPLLGLLGTVLGMLDIFGHLRLGGAASTELASGIGQALITTQIGLLVALPISVGRGFLASRLRRLTIRLELWDDHHRARPRSNRGPSSTAASSTAARP